MQLNTYLFKIRDDSRTFCLSKSAESEEAAILQLLQTLEYEGELIEVIDDKSVKTRRADPPPKWNIRITRADHGNDEGPGEGKTKSS